MNKIERAHQMYRDGRYEEALDFYTEALSMAKTKPQKIALHSNRAACYLKLHDFKKAAEECTSVLELDNKHTGALMLRAQTLVTLKEYNSALFDVNRLIELNPSSEVYQNLQARLKTQLALAPIPEAEAELEDDDEELEEHDVDQEGKPDEDKVEGKEDKEGEADEEESSVLVGGGNHKDEPGGATPKTVVTTTPQNLDQNASRSVTAPQTQSLKEPQEHWEAIPKPKGHSRLDYSRWDKVVDDSSEDEDDEDDEESPLQYRFCVRTVGIRPVK